MKKTITILSILSLSLGLNAQKQKTPQDSIKVFYNELFSVLEKSYLNRKSVDWKTVESETKDKLKSYDNFEKSLTEIKPFFDKINANHCLIFYNNKKYSGTGKVITKDDFSEQWKKKFDTKPAFEAKMIDEKYGYILMPNMLFFDLSPENINKIAQPLYDKIAEIKSNNKPEGWILDLRFNTGGNSTPMLLALYDLLGDNVVWGTLDGNKKMISKIKLNQGKYLDGSKKPAFINPKGELMDKTKVAVITGLFTGSSGEVTALAFKGRPNTIFIGEKTYGATTANTQYTLPFGSTMAITIGYDSDRNGNYYEQIIPNVFVSKKDNFDNLLLDGNFVEAVKFF
ncbi:S41 family peptidase [Epilithonimonas arachidiradicis]|uniref:Peptidase S41-like protein n=1 Tax=Epilithonimonas arachidiradicis TaxID=1617282 RepID=A0A420CQ00_9FLAO|nr:S41 family peptidase [Epilithonimonas arachidiradicis]RKE80452.1 peptidase S41-like protein [Epilithonimonas arachidiradicis]GGG63658.1 hypothetical protein GCM10007332_27320 [Epilithonimonas arachidiradicis]